MKLLTIALCCFLALVPECGGQKPVQEPDPLDVKISQMSLREKVGTLFFVRPEALKPDSWPMEALPEEAKAFCEEYPVGGVVLFAHNILDSLQLNEFTSAIHALPGRPFVCVDEEGGRVARIANNPSFDVPRYASMEAVGNTGETAKAYEAGASIGSYLKRFGFDMDFAPVADVNTNPNNIVIGARAFSGDPWVAASMVVKCMKGLMDEGIVPCLKHFPGHGDTFGDTHEGYVQIDKTWEQMLEAEIIPFRAGIRSGAPVVMIAHISIPNVIGDDIPASLSSLIMQDKLREELGFEGVIITDAIGMGAISKRYSSGEAALACFLAGADIILMPDNLTEAFDALLAAVEDGTIGMERLDASVRRILSLKK